LDISAHHHRKPVIDAQRIQPCHMKAPRILRTYQPQHSRRIGLDGLLQHRYQRRPAVLRIEIDLACHQRLVRQQRPSQIEPAIYSLVQPPLQMLSDDLAHHYLLSEVLGPHPQRVPSARTGTTYDRQRCDHARDNLRSTHPNPPSAASAISAAGTAPAKICTVSTEATPRKMKTPNPPPPIAAAIVAVPMVVTAATRIPAKIVGAASGNSTCRSICPPVIPIATAAS